MTVNELAWRDVKHAENNYLRALKRKGATDEEIAHLEELVKLRERIAKLTKLVRNDTASVESVRWELVESHTLMAAVSCYVRCPVCGVMRGWLVGDNLRYCPNCGTLVDGGVESARD